MKIISDPTMHDFRILTRCEWCGRSTPEGTDPHHVFGRGHGGGWRLDWRGNLIGLCRSYVGMDFVSCHAEAHAGKIERASLLAVIATREGLMQSDLEAQIRRLQNAPKECKPCRWCDAFGWLRGNVTRACKVCSGSGILNQHGEPWGIDGRTNAGCRNGAVDAGDRQRHAETHRADGIHGALPRPRRVGNAGMAPNEADQGEGWVRL